MHFQGILMKPKQPHVEFGFDSSTSLFDNSNYSPSALLYNVTRKIEDVFLKLSVSPIQNLEDSVSFSQFSPQLQPCILVWIDYQHFQQEHNLISRLTSSAIDVYSMVGKEGGKGRYGKIVTEKDMEKEGEWCRKRKKEGAWYRKRRKEKKMNYIEKKARKKVNNIGKKKKEGELYRKRKKEGEWYRKRKKERKKVKDIGKERKKECEWYRKGKKEGEWYRKRKKERKKVNDIGKERKKERKKEGEGYRKRKKERWRI